MIRTKPLTRKKPLRRKSRKCSQAKDAHGMTPAMRDFALRDTGCVVARLRGVGVLPGTKHHLLTTGMHGNGKRRGEAYTVLLNDWSHQGNVLPGWTEERCERELGPSYARNAAAFRAEFPDELLLAEQERALAEWRGSCVA